MSALETHIRELTCSRFKTSRRLRETLVKVLKTELDGKAKKRATRGKQNGVQARSQRE